MLESDFCDTSAVTWEGVGQQNEELCEAYELKMCSRTGYQSTVDTPSNFIQTIIRISQLLSLANTWDEALKILSIRISAESEIFNM